MNADKLGALAINAMMLALSTTVKPGLVDRRSPASRKELDFFMILNGITALSPWLIEIARESTAGINLSPTSLFSNIRRIGHKAERDMFKASNGVNTNKGAFFCLALCVGAAGRIISSRLKPDSDRICALVTEMCYDMCQHELDTLDVKINVIGADSLTAGERVYMDHKLTGVRGEARSGFATVREHALPLMNHLTTSENLAQNDVYVQTCLALMANTKDTGVCDKEGGAAMDEVMDWAGSVLEKGGVLTPNGREKISKFDARLRTRKLYPGAANTLLNVAIFLDLINSAAGRP